MLIISGSNVGKTKENSSSLKVSYRIKNKLHENNVDSAVLDLRKYKIDFCNMCEECATTSRCIQNDQFNELYEIINNNRTIIFVVPHYAGIPSKIVAFFEKIQEMCYLQYCRGIKINNNHNIAIIAHGGMCDNYRDVYVNNIINPFSYMAKSVGYNVINDNISKPLCFGVKKYYQEKEKGSHCYKKEDDLKASEAVIDLLLPELVARSKFSDIIRIKREKGDMRC